MHISESRIKHKKFGEKTRGAKKEERGEWKRLMP